MYACLLSLGFITLWLLNVYLSPVSSAATLPWSVHANWLAKLSELFYWISFIAAIMPVCFLSDYVI